MILRVPDYYEDFHCIADKCKDSCCIGWEIDIDEDTYGYYQSIQGAFGERLKQNIVPLKDEEGYSFALGAHRRCPFLNTQNLCDICIELGEEALSEVCTEYPRFSLYYGNVLQKCLTLSCEEVDRILFTREESVQFLDIPMGQEEDEELESWEQAGFAFFEYLQQKSISLLQDRKLSIWNRMEKLLFVMEQMQDSLDQADETDLRKEMVDVVWEEIAETWKPLLEEHSSEEHLIEKTVKLRHSFDEFQDSFHIFERMEVLDHEWRSQRNKLKEIYQKDNYEVIKENYQQIAKESDYEQLLVYFFFRYFMQSVYDFNILSKARLAVEFTLMIHDMDALCFYEKKNFSLEDRINIVRIFSKEVEHSEENVLFAEKEIEKSHKR